MEFPYLFVSILDFPSQGDFTWSSLSGRSVRLTPVAIQSLSELERTRLQEVAYTRLLQDYDLGCQITMPKGGSLLSFVISFMTSGWVRFAASDCHLWQNASIVMHFIHLTQVYSVILCRCIQVSHKVRSRTQASDHILLSSLKCVFREVMYGLCLGKFWQRMNLDVNHTLQRNRVLPVWHGIFGASSVWHATPFPL